MTRAKKIALGTVIALVLLVVVSIAAANWLLQAVSREALVKLAARAKRQGVVVSEPRFGGARIAGIRTARWTDLSGRLEFPTSDAFAPGKTFDVRVGQAELWLVGGGQAVLEAREIDVDSTSPVRSDILADQTDQEEIRAARFRCQFALDPFHPLPSLEETLPELIALIRVGATQLPIEIDGKLKFVFDGTTIEAGLDVSQSDRGQVLVLEPKDLGPVAAHFDEPITDAELELIANYPLRANRLLHIKDDAETAAAEAHEVDDQVPEDAYRHILWSFLLTRQYGPQFAERVTNAHEDLPGNPPAARKMDVHNNAVGRTWAQQSVRRSDILSRVLNDREVIREPQ